MTNQSTPILAPFCDRWMCAAAHLRFHLTRNPIHMTDDGATKACYDCAQTRNSLPRRGGSTPMTSITSPGTADDYILAITCQCARTV